MWVRNVRDQLRGVLAAGRRSLVQHTPPRLGRYSRNLMFALARRYRIALGAVGATTWIGITGSSGKTTTKELIAAVLTTQGRVRKSTKLLNGPRFVAETIFTVFPWHRFCVHELGVQAVGEMAQAVMLFRPQVGVVTTIGRDHYKAFRNLETTATEKGGLVAALPTTGTAILNADDPLVLAMRERTAARVVTYGLSAEAMVRGEAILCAWPQRLALTVVHGADRIRVQTQLLAEHFAHAVLAAVATGIAHGVPLVESARAIAEVAPVEGRMCPHALHDGVTFIRDDWKAPWSAMPATLRFLETARARRRIMILGTMSDYSGSASGKYRALARAALEAADQVIFVGPFSRSAFKARNPADGDRLMAFDTLYECDRFLAAYLAPGDLVLLKGTHRANHLERLVLARTERMPCWRARCGRMGFCDSCRLRYSPAIPARRDDASADDTNDADSVLGAPMIG